MTACSWTTVVAMKALVLRGFCFVLEQTYNNRIKSISKMNIKFINYYEQTRKTGIYIYIYIYMCVCVQLSTSIEIKTTIIIIHNHRQASSFAQAH